MADFFDAISRAGKRNYAADPQNYTGTFVVLPTFMVMAAIRDHVFGGVTANQILNTVRNMFTERGETLSAAGEAELNAVINDVMAQNANQRQSRIDEWTAVLLLAERGLAYTTVAAVRTRMGV